MRARVRVLRDRTVRVQAQPHGGRDRRPGATLQRSREDAGHGANVVFMGMGEPLLNWENLRIALLLLVDERYLDVGARRITVSTVGVPDRIVALGEGFRRYGWRSRCMRRSTSCGTASCPSTGDTPCDSCSLPADCGARQREADDVRVPPPAGRQRPPEDVAALGRVVEGLSVQVNLMRYNPIPGADFRRPSVHETERFRDALRRETGAAVTIRRSRGLDIEERVRRLRLARGGSVVDAGRERVKPRIGIVKAGIVFAEMILPSGTMMRGSRARSVTAWCAGSTKRRPADFPIPVTRMPGS